MVWFIKKYFFIWDILLLFSKIPPN